MLPCAIFSAVPGLSPLSDKETGLERQWAGPGHTVRAKLMRLKAKSELSGWTRPKLGEPDAEGQDRPQLAPTCQEPGLSTRHCSRWPIGPGVNEYIAAPINSRKAADVTLNQVPVPSTES